MRIAGQHRHKASRCSVNFHISLAMCLQAQRAQLDKERAEAQQQLDTLSAAAKAPTPARGQPSADRLIDAGERLDILTGLQVGGMVLGGAQVVGLAQDLPTLPHCTCLHAIVPWHQSASHIPSDVCPTRALLIYFQSIHIHNPHVCVHSLGDSRLQQTAAGCCASAWGSHASSASPTASWRCSRWLWTFLQSACLRRQATSCSNWVCRRDALLPCSEPCLCIQPWLFG